MNGFDVHKIKFSESTDNSCQTPVKFLIILIYFSYTVIVYGSISLAYGKERANGNNVYKERICLILPKNSSFSFKSVPEKYHDQQHGLT